MRIVFAVIASVLAAHGGRAAEPAEPSEAVYVVTTTCPDVVIEAGKDVSELPGAHTARFRDMTTPLFGEARVFVVGDAEVAGFSFPVGVDAPPAPGRP
jgi:hypothetical protein